MKIGVISDTHDNVDRINESIEIFNKEELGLVIHAGDVTSPFALIPFDGLKADFVGIFGNNDGDKILLKERSKGRIHRQPHKMTLGGKRIVIMHEPDLVEDLALSGNFDLIIYGHTHKARVDRINNTLVLNPGEAGHWLYGKATIAVVDLEGMDAKVVNLR